MTGAVSDLQQQLKAAKSDISDLKQTGQILVKAIEDPKNSPFVGVDGKMSISDAMKKQLGPEFLKHESNFNVKAISRSWWLDEIRSTNVRQRKLIPVIDEKKFAAPSALDLKIESKQTEIQKRSVKGLSIEDQLVEMSGLLVERKELNEKGKSDPVPVTHPVLRSLLRNRMGGKGGRLQNVRTTLAFVGSQSSAANTALQFVQNVDPSTSAEFASFASLFDECKVHGGVIRLDVGTSGGTPTFTDLAMAYDPVDPSVYTNISAVLVASHHIGPLKLEASTAVGAQLNGPAPVDKSGYWSLKFKCPNGPQVSGTNSAAANEVVTGMWASTAQTPMFFGFMKGYVPGAGTSVVVTTYYYLILDIEFRSRT